MLYAGRRRSSVLQLKPVNSDSRPSTLTPAQRKDRSRIKFNVSGTHYETYKTTLLRYPNTLLGNPVKLAQFYDESTDEYFFDRDADCFKCILGFYQSDGGSLVIPQFMDLEILTEELIFFDMTYELIEREKLKANDEDLFKNKKGELSKLSRLRLKISFTWSPAIFNGSILFLNRYPNIDYIFRSSFHFGKFTAIRSRASWRGTVVKQRKSCCCIRQNRLFLYWCVHNGNIAETALYTQSEIILLGPAEHHRYSGRSSFLYRTTNTSESTKWRCNRSRRSGLESRFISNPSNHSIDTSCSNFEIFKIQQKFANTWKVALQIWTWNQFPCCLLYDFLNPMRNDSILRGNERKRNIVWFDTVFTLVGYCHNDHGWLWWYVSNNRLGPICWLCSSILRDSMCGVADSIYFKCIWMWI